MKHLFKGKPSKIVPVKEARDAFDEELFCKPPSARSRSVFMEKLVKLTDSDESAAVASIAEIAIDLILITSCDKNGVPFFTKDEREFLEDELPINYHDILIKAGADIMGCVPNSILDGMLMDIIKDDEETEDEDEADESKEGKPD